MLSSIIPDTVQLIVLVAGLCSKAPAFEVILPAGIAPFCKAQTNFSLHCSWISFSSTSESALATLR